MGGSAPTADPAMGQAALLSAQTGQDMLAWSQDQAKIANRWAKQDRKRWKKKFRPVENQFIEDATGYDTEERRDQEMMRAEASVRQQTSLSRGATRRTEAAMGVDPTSGRSTESSRRLDNAEALAAVGAGNQARGNVIAEGRRRVGEVVNLGQGSKVNPGSSLSLASGTGMQGFQGAMNGYGQQANILGQQHGQQMQAYQSNQGAMGSLMGGLGALGGAIISNPGSLAMLSDEGSKTNKRPARGSLKAVKNMRVDDWSYKDGAGDGGEHRGTYAQDFQRETGKGDGKSINMIDAIGVTMGAVKELSAQVDKIAPRGARRAAS